MPDKLCFDVAARDGQWIISVSGAMVLACKDKRTALAAMRAATKLLVQAGSGACAGAATRADGCVGEPPVARSA